MIARLEEMKVEEADRVFTEGWIEFKSKKVAKSVAANLNCNPVGGKRRSKAHDELWNIKYLPRFKWVHLSERLAYESAVKQQRMRTEIAQVKREAEHFKSSVEKKRKKSKKDKVEDETSSVSFQFKQRETEKQMRKRKRDENVFTVTDIEVSPAKKKKPKKQKDSSEEVSKVPMKSKSKKSKKGREKSGPTPRKQLVEGDRSEFLKSVFGGGT